jgi:hypothetical protein
MESRPKPSSLCLVSSNFEDAAFAAEVCNSSGLEFKRFDQVEQAADWAAKGEAAALFVDIRDADAFERVNQAIKKASTSPKYSLNPEAIYLLTALTIEEAPYLISGPSFFNYVLRNYKDPKEAGRLYGRILKAVLAAETLNLSNLLGENAQVESIKPKTSGEKGQSIEHVLKFLGEVKFHPRIATKIAGAADELLMNAIFDAPASAEGGSPSPGHPSDIALEGRREIDMQVGYDGVYAAVLVSDHFGSLDASHLLEKLTKNYVASEYRPTPGAGRAGLGIFTVFHSGGSLFYLVKKTRRTDALVFFRNTETFREFREQFRFFTLRSGKK